MLPSGSRIICMIYCSRCFLGWICTVQQIDRSCTASHNGRVQLVCPENGTAVLRGLSSPRFHIFRSCRFAGSRPLRATPCLHNCSPTFPCGNNATDNHARMLVSSRTKKLIDPPPPLPSPASPPRVCLSRSFKSNAGPCGAPHRRRAH